MVKEATPEIEVVEPVKEEVTEDWEEDTPLQAVVERLHDKADKEVTRVLKVHSRPDLPDDRGWNTTGVCPTDTLLWQ